MSGDAPGAAGGSPSSAPDRRTVGREASGHPADIAQTEGSPATREDARVDGQRAGGATLGERRGLGRGARLPTRKRPFGIYAIIVLLLLKALAFFADAALYSSSWPGLSLSAIDDVFVIRMIDYQLALLQLIVALGIWLLRRWAWVATMILIGVGMAIGILRYAHETPLYPAMLLHVLVVFYLNQREVQALFTRRRARTVAA